MSDIEQRIRDYYAQQSLDDAALERVCQAGRLTRRPRWRQAGWAAAALALVVAFLAVFLSLPGPDDRLTESVAREVIENHKKQLDPETSGGSFGELQAALPRLQFAIAPEKPELLGDWRPAGGRYCSLGGELAAQINLEEPDGATATLYIAPLTSTLEKVDPCVRRYDGTEVHFWRDAHRLFALAVDVADHE